MAACEGKDMSVPDLGIHHLLGRPRCINKLACSGSQGLRSESEPGSHRPERQGWLSRTPRVELQHHTVRLVLGPLPPLPGWPA